MKLFILLLMMVSFSSFAAVDFNRCTDCHENKVKGSAHGGIANECLFCHTKHFSSEKENTYNLRFEKVKDLCLDCHDNYRTGMGQGHPVNNHPVEGKKDPLHKDRRFDCASCHNPHGSSAPDLLRYDGLYKKRGKMGFCQSCHKNYGGQRDGTTPPWE